MGLLAGVEVGEEVGIGVEDWFVVIIVYNPEFPQKFSELLANS